MPSVEWTNDINHVDDEDVWLNIDLNVHSEKATSADASTSPLPGLLRDWERQLRCHICHEFYCAPVALNGCFHVFCSECIRQFISTSMTSMRRQASCPVCKQFVDFKNLIPNRALEELIKTFQAMREPLKTALIRNSETARIASASAHDNCDNMNLAKACDTNVAAVAEKAASVSRLEKKPKVMYKNLKHKQLVRLCQNEGLWCHGTDQQLIDRHAEFLNLYQAECDSFHPRSISELVNVVHEREKARQQAKLKPAFASSSTADKSSPVAAAANMNVMDAGFSKLIWQEKERRKKRTKEPKISVLEPAQQKDDGDEEQNDIDTKDQLLMENKQNPGLRQQPYFYTEFASNATTATSNAMNVPAGNDELKRPSLPSKRPLLLSASEKADTNSVEIMLDSDDDGFSENHRAHLSKKAKNQSSLDHSTANAVQSISNNNQLKSNDNGFALKHPERPSSSSKRSNRERKTVWTCTRCTYLNKTNWWKDAKCEMCHFSRALQSRIPTFTPMISDTITIDHE